VADIGHHTPSTDHGLLLSHFAPQGLEQGGGKGVQRRLVVEAVEAALKRCRPHDFARVRGPDVYVSERENAPSFHPVDHG